MRLGQQCRTVKKRLEFHPQDGRADGGSRLLDGPFASIASAVNADADRQAEDHQRRELGARGRLRQA